MQILWLVIDIVVGVIVAGAVAPFAIAALPDARNGAAFLAAVAVACIVIVSLLRHAFIGTPGATAKRQGDD